jgi:hypothetical protein
MLSLCIFSKDRPMQLDLCLKSLKNAPYITDVKVLYLPQGRFELGYEIVKKEHPNITFIKENDHFSDQAMDIVKNSNEYFLWGTDDSLFCHQVEITQDKLDWVFKTQRAISIILRYGANVIMENHWENKRSRPMEVLAQYKDIVIWDVYKHYDTYHAGRPWQNDASIMPRDMYLERMEIETEWRKHKSKTLDYLAQSGRIFNPCLAATFPKVVYLNIPVNLVHLHEDGKTYADYNNWGKYIRYDVNLLNELFIYGKRINLGAIDLHNVDCSAREIEYVFEE